MNAQPDAGPCVFVVPVHTGRGLNERLHWAERSARVAVERKAVALCFPRPYKRWAEDESNAGWCMAVHLTRGSPGTLDSDNLQGSMKGVRDEVAKQLGLDDRDSRLAWTYHQQRTKRGEYWVRVEFEEVPR